MQFLSLFLSLGFNVYLCVCMSKPNVESTSSMNNEKFILANENIFIIIMKFFLFNERKKFFWRNKNIVWAKKRCWMAWYDYHHHYYYIVYVYEQCAFFSIRFNSIQARQVSVPYVLVLFFFRLKCFRKESIGRIKSLSL